MNSSNSRDMETAVIRIAQAMANSRRENVWLIIDKRDGVITAHPDSEWNGVENHELHGLFRLVTPQ